jgi:ABC-type branched-subunit amino acid transport system substrate-binding protein
LLKLASRRRRLAITALVTVAVATAGLGTTSAGASTASAKSCNGPAIKVMNVANLTNTIQTITPEVPAAVRAAAKQITKTCQMGGPVTVLSCDDKFSPNDAGQCAREAVSQKVLALVGTYGSWGDIMGPIAAAAGIPSVGNNTNGSWESTNPMSFGTFDPPEVFSGFFTLAASVGAKTALIMYLDLPPVKFFVDLGAKQAEAVGIKIVDTVPVPVTATDMAQFAARVVSSGADALMPVLGGQQAGLIRQLAQQGVSLRDDLIFVSGLNTITPEFIADLGDDVVGAYTAGGGITPDEKKEPAIKRFRKEMKKAKEDVSNLTWVASNAWAAMHMIADVMEGASTIDSATLVSRLQSAGPIDMEKYGISNLDFAKNPFPAGHPLAAIPRIFQDTVTFNQVGEDLKMHWLGKEFFPVLEVRKVKSLKF